ncbi:MAG: hypothetical protein GY821_10845 [Gammaproteobacteria bacterium]|nr:hypothetical protein [Gammaproteobacteria bacterium]
MHELDKRISNAPSQIEQMEEEIELTIKAIDDQKALLLESLNRGCRIEGQDEKEVAVNNCANELINIAKGSKSFSHSALAYGCNWSISYDKMNRPTECINQLWGLNSKLKGLKEECKRLDRQQSDDKENYPHVEKNLNKSLEKLDKVDEFKNQRTHTILADAILGELNDNYQGKKEDRTTLPEFCNYAVKGEKANVGFFSPKKWALAKTGEKTLNTAINYIKQENKDSSERITETLSENKKSSAKKDDNNSDANMLEEQVMKSGTSKFMTNFYNSPGHSSDYDKNEFNGVPDEIAVQILQY